MNYVVKSGNTLSSIARDVLGDITLWPYLASINSIPSPYTIYPGQVLNIGVAEVSADTDKKKNWISGLIIGGVAFAIAAVVYHRKKIFKKKD